MEKKQSSIDWFITEFQKQIEFVPNSELDIWFKNLFPQAKAMHKEEIQESYREGRSDQQSKEIFYHRNSEQYYNETFE